MSNPLRSIDRMLTPTPPEVVRAQETTAMAAAENLARVRAEETRRRQEEDQRATTERAAAERRRAEEDARRAAAPPVTPETPKPDAPKPEAPTPAAPPTMPDPESGPAIEAARRAQAAARARAGRSSTILTAPTERSPTGRSSRRTLSGGYSSTTLG